MKASLGVVEPNPKLISH